MTHLFQSIANYIPQCHGWCSVAKAQTLAAAVIALRPDISLEIGVWGGRSLFPMAMAHKELGKGRVIAIDPWARQASKQGQIGQDAVWWGEVADHDAVYADFIKRSHELCVAHLIEVRRMTSDLYGPIPQIDIFSLDGNHGPQAIVDVERYAPKVRVGGLVFLDDLDWQGGAVRTASQRLMAMGFAEIGKLDTGAIYQRVK